MSASQSRLSDPKYGYDMVVATTQASVNATMKEWLSKYSGKPFTQAYVYNKNLLLTAGGPVVTDFEKLKVDIGCDPFDIPDGTDVDDEALLKLRSKKFMYAFQAELGFPDFPMDLIPPVISFDKSGSLVTYNMVCKTFKIIGFRADDIFADPEWVNVNQDDADEPWVFKFSVNLDLLTKNISTQFHNLPKETQDEIMNLGEDMFSVQQLFLDLNVAALRDTVEIKGVGNKIKVFLSEVFIQEYIKSISANGGIMLGFAAVSHKPMPSNVSLIPTSMNFEICSYKERLEPTTDYNAFTLNYLIMTKNRPMPAPVQFEWNWVDKDKTTQFAGVMAVNRNSFVTFLHETLSDTLKYVAKRPNVYFHCNCVKADFTYKYDPEPTPQQFRIVQNGGIHVLSYNYSANDQSSDTTFCGIWGTWGNLSSNYAVKSDVFLEGARITIETTITVFMHLNVMGGVTEGNFAKKKLVTYYNIGVSAQGRLTVRKDGPPIEDQSEDPRTDVWAKIITAGQVDGLVNSMRKTLKDMIDRFLTNDSALIERMLNGSRSWVFPGGKTFVFKDAQFSEGQDLVANVLYVAPNTPPKVIESLLVAAKKEDAILESKRLQLLAQFS
jgi:hypothetical protein